MINYLKSKLSSLDVHTLFVVKKSAASIVVKISGMTVGLIVSIFLGRILGADGLGVIELSNQIVNILLVISLAGFYQIIIKEVAIAHNEKNTKHIGNVMFSAFIFNGLLSTVISIALILVTPWASVYFFNEPRLIWPLTIALMVLTPRIFSRIFSAALVGYGRIWQSNLVDQTLSLVIVGFLLLVIHLINIEITIIIVAIVYGFARLIVTASMIFYWKKLFSFTEKPKLIIKQLLKVAFPLFLITATAIIATSSSSIILGLQESSQQVGLYSVAARIALLTSFFLQVTNSAISPKLASLFAEGRIKEMEKMVQQVTKGLGIIALIPFFVFLIAGKYILNIWGPEFVEAYWVLIILSIGQFVNISTGAASLLLTMCGYEKTQSKISLVMVVANIFFCTLFTYYWGIIGTATAVSITIAGENIVLVLYAKRKIGVSTLSFFKN